MPPIRRALILGGTGMLAGCVSALVNEGWLVVLPSRRYAPIPADPKLDPATPRRGIAVQSMAMPLVRKALWVPADWSAPAELADRAGKALGGPADLLVAWVHSSFRASVLTAVAPLLADGAPVVEVHGSSSANPVGGCPEPVLTGHPTQQVVLGFLRTAGRTRWLTHAETSDGVLAAVRRSLDGRTPAVHQVGQFRPWNATRA